MPFLYYVFGAAIAVGTLVGLVFALYYWAVLILRWKTPKRRIYAARLVIAIASIPCIFGLNYLNIRFILLPARRLHEMAEISARRAQHLKETTFVNIGDACPSFSLTTIDGDTVSLPLPNKVVLIIFFATWCGPCQMELPHIERIWSDLKNDDRFRLVVVGREETAETVGAFRQQRELSFPIAADPDRKVYSLFAKEAMPRTILVSPEGTVVYSNAGFYETDIEDLRSVLKQQLETLR